MVSFVFRDVWSSIKEIAIWILSRKMMIVAALCPHKQKTDSFIQIISHNLVKNDIMEVMLVVIGVLAPVNRSKLENAVAVVGVGAGAGVGLD
jgi:hydrogenase/urease accessory protein HupE